LGDKELVPLDALFHILYDFVEEHKFASPDSIEFDGSQFNPIPLKDLFKAGTLATMMYAGLVVPSANGADSFERTWQDAVTRVGKMRGHAHGVKAQLQFVFILVTLMLMHEFIVIENLNSFFFYADSDGDKSLT